MRIHLCSVQCTCFNLNLFSTFVLLQTRLQILLKFPYEDPNMATASLASAEGQDVLKKNTNNFSSIQIPENAMTIFQGRLALFVSGAPKFDTLNLGVQLAD